ncbi:MAG: EamA family transporter [Bryobacteraceae bacterium]|nr:EamA family transporter [Bryobacteraceae bacterium]
MNPAVTGTPISSMLYVLLGSFVGSFGAVFLKAGAEKLHRNWTSLFFNYRLALGVGLFLLSSYFFVLGVRKGELTVLYPLVSVGYIWTLLWSRIFFGEPLTKSKFVGLGMILLGIVFLGLGSR